MGIIASKKDYKTPTAKVVEINAQGVICQSGQTEMITVDFDNVINENDWEY